MVRLLRPARTMTPVRAVIVAVLAPAAVTVLALPFAERPVIAASLYVLGVALAAALGGTWSGLGASVLSALALNFFFTPPLHTLRVERLEDVVALLVFFAVAAIVGSLLARALEERSRAAGRERESRLLSYFATKLLSGEPLELVLHDFAGALTDQFDLVRCEIRAHARLVDLDAVSELGGPSGPATTVPVVVGDTSLGTLTAVRRAGAPEIDGSDLQLLGSCAKQIAVAIERTRLDSEVERVRVESETAELRAALFSSVSHDLRTPLASIKASVTSLLGVDAVHDPDQQRELLETVLEETDRLNRLVGNILDLARIRAGALVPAKEPTDLEEVLESVLHRMQPVLDHVTVRTVVRPDLPDVLADPVQIDQVLTNLLENAARFSPPGGTIQVAIGPWKRSVQVRVSDQGPGIPEEARERVFEVFYRADGAASGGSGLGLAIARAIVQAHGGRMWAEGAPTGGAAVVFELPLLDVSLTPDREGRPA